MSDLIELVFGILISIVIILAFRPVFIDQLGKMGGNIITGLVVLFLFIVGAKAMA